MDLLDTLEANVLHVLLVLFLIHLHIDVIVGLDINGAMIKQDAFPDTEKDIDFV